VYIEKPNGDSIIPPTCNPSHPGPITEPSGEMVVHFRIAENACNACTGFEAQFDVIPTDGMLSLLYIIKVKLSQFSIDSPKPVYLW